MNSVGFEAPISQVDWAGRAKQNWENRKIQVIAAGSFTAVALGGLAVAFLLGSPTNLIVGLAAATLATLGLTLAALFRTPITFFHTESGLGWDSNVAISALPFQFDPYYTPDEKVAEATHTQPEIDDASATTLQRELRERSEKNLFENEIRDQPDDGFGLGPYPQLSSPTL